MIFQYTYRIQVDDLRSSLKIDENIFIEKNTNTSVKMTILRRLFVLFGLDPMDLVFYLKDEENEPVIEEGRHNLRIKYWTYALPSIQQANAHRGCFRNVSPLPSNTVSGFFGISGFHISCIANYDSARVDFVMGKSDPLKNKASFDILYGCKDEIEEKIGAKLSWDRADESKTSSISIILDGVSITQENDWERMSKFHAHWSVLLCDTLLPYLQKQTGNKNRIVELAALFREWITENEAVNEDLANCTRKYIRFTTDAMSAMLPSITNSPSAWGTDNHYYYEIINNTGNSFYIKFVVNSDNATDSFLDVCNRINKYFPAKHSKADWQYRTHFKTKTIIINEPISKDELFISLDKSLEEIQLFEKDLESKLTEV